MQTDTQGVLHDNVLVVFGKHRTLHVKAAEDAFLDVCVILGVVHWTGNQTAFLVNKNFAELVSDVGSLLHALKIYKVFSTPLLFSSWLLSHIGIKRI
jgi:hypothetical protein